MDNNWRKDGLSTKMFHSKTLHQIIDQKRFTKKNSPESQSPSWRSFLPPLLSLQSRFFLSYFSALSENKNQRNRNFHESFKNFFFFFFFSSSNRKTTNFCSNGVTKFFAAHRWRRRSRSKDLSHSKPDGRSLENISARFGRRPLTSDSTRCDAIPPKFDFHVSVSVSVDVRCRKTSVYFRSKHIWKKVRRKNVRPWTAAKRLQAGWKPGGRGFEFSPGLLSSFKSYQAWPIYLNSGG